MSRKGVRKNQGKKGVGDALIGKGRPSVELEATPRLPQNGAKGWLLPLSDGGSPADSAAAPKRYGDGDCADLPLDKWQANLHNSIQKGAYLAKDGLPQRIIDWTTFYRRNMHRFVEDYFGIKLHLYQQMIVYLMGTNHAFCLVAARATAKSFMIGIFACAKAVLYPGSLIVISAAAWQQTRIIISEKVRHEIVRNSYNLTKEIKKIIDNQNEVLVAFRNGSQIIATVANENARGHRCTVMIYEEFRMIIKNIIDSVLSPFAIIRQAPYLKRLEYEPYYEDLKEEPSEFYISSAWFQTHWMWNLMRLFLKEHYKGSNMTILCFDYAVTLKHNIRTFNQLIRERKKLDPISWRIEYENKMIAQNTRAFFTYDLLRQNQTLKRAFYPRRNVDYAMKKQNGYAIKKQDGEVRIVSCDIAIVEGKQNDNSVFSCMRLLPERITYTSSDVNGLHVEVKQGFRRQVCYLEAFNAANTERQAVRIKQLFADFEADFCVLDTRNVGISVYDALAKILYDDERSVEYTPWSCVNDEKTANRVQIAGARKIVYAVVATARLNSEIAATMRDSLSSGKIDLLVSYNDAIEEIIKRIPEYSATTDLDLQLYYERPFLETTALISEMLALEYEVAEQTGYIKVKEASNMRKDRYTSVSYGNYFAGLLERDLMVDTGEYEYVPLYN